MLTNHFPPFVPHPLLRGAHAQTLAGAFLPTRRYRYQARRHCITLDDGDRVILHDDCPDGWRPPDRTALLIHGLAGCHDSGYMRRIAHKLKARGVRAFRLDLRGCGAGFGLARLPYHSGRSEDAAAVLRFIGELCDGSPTTLVGFSLGGNITLKLLGELQERPCGALDSGMAVCPPIDLAACSRQLQRAPNQIYDRHFVKLLLKQLHRRRRVLPDAALVEFARRPRKLWDLDDVYTAPVCGFGTAENYYRSASSAQFVPYIRLPTLILTSRDDPLVPYEPFEKLSLPPAVSLQITSHGGHLGFFSRKGTDPDRRWMDWRVVDWVKSQLDANDKR